MAISARSGATSAPSSTGFVNKPATQNSDGSISAVRMLNGKQVNMMYDPRTGSLTYSSAKIAGGKPQHLDPSQATRYFAPQTIANLRNLAQPNGQQPYFYEPNVNADTSKTPEANAITEIAKTDPGFVNQMNQLSSYYNTQGQNLNNPNNVQNQQNQLLSAQAKNDPSTAAATAALGKNYAEMAANPGQLSDSVQRDISQAARAAQAARGNSLGTSQAAQESLQSGLYGQQLQQQQMQMAQQWLGSGLTKTGQGQQLYNFNQGAQNQNAANVANYLGSGTTPIAVGSKYNNDIQNQANQAAGTGTYYQPTQMGNPWTYLNPQSGPQFSQQSAQWYSMLPGQGGGGANPGMSAATGALSGAASGAMAGSMVYPGIGTAIGALGGALIGGLGGYGSGGGFR